MKKAALIILVVIASVQIGTTIAGGFDAGKSVASISAKRIAMMEQVEKN